MAHEVPGTVPGEVVSAFGLEDAHLEPVRSGLYNRHWLAAAGGATTVLRCYHAARTSAAVAWEQSLVEHAATRNWPVASPLRSAAGATLVEADGALWAAMPYRGGVPGSAERPGHYHILGRLLARLHQDLASFEPESQRPGAGKTWELDAWVAPADAGTFNELLTLFGREYPDLASVIRRQRYRNLRDLSRLHYPDLPDRPIHGDFQRDNLLWEDGNLTGLLDFDLCRRDALVCDIAPLLVPHMPLDLRLAAALIEGYQAVRPLSDLEWDVLPSLVRSSLLLWVSHLLVGWRLNGLPPDGIARTMTLRFPAFESAEPAFRALADGLRV